MLPLILRNCDFQKWHLPPDGSQDREKHLNCPASSKALEGIEHFLGNKNYMNQSMVIYVIWWLGILFSKAFFEGDFLGYHQYLTPTNHWLNKQNSGSRPNLLTVDQFFGGQPWLKETICLHPLAELKSDVHIFKWPPVPWQKTCKWIYSSMYGNPLYYIYNLYTYI